MSEEDYFPGIIAISGHRDYGDPAVLYRSLDRLNARSYMFGGARGIDTDALTYIAQTQPGSIRTVVVPNTMGDQPIEARFAIKNYATEVIELKNTGSDRYFIRNRYLVNNCDRLEAFYDLRGRGGTFQTIKYARSMGKDLNVNLLSGTDFDYFFDKNERDFMYAMDQLKMSGVNIFQLKGVSIQYFKHKGVRTPRRIIERFREWESE